MNGLRTCAAAVATSIAIICIVAAGIAQAEPLKIRISWVAVPANLPPLFMEKPDLMTRSGQSYVVDAIRYPGMQQSVAALAAGEVDIALLSFSSLPLAIQNARIEDLRVIGDEITDGAPGHYSAEFLVLKDSPVKTVKDLKGRTIAINTRGSATDVALRAMTKKNGLEEKRDFTATEIAYADMKAALLGNKIDAAAVGMPALSGDPELREATRTLFTQRDALGSAAQSMWVARKEYLEKNRAALIDFMADTLRARRFYMDPKNHTEAVDIVSRVTKQPREQLDPWLFGKDDFYRSPDGLPDIAILQHNFDRMAELGFLKIDAKKILDLSIVKDAGAKLLENN